MSDSRAAIIGWTGLIGGNLLDQYKKKFDIIDLFNSKNINKINKKLNTMLFFVQHYQQQNG